MAPELAKSRPLRPRLAKSPPLTGFIVKSAANSQIAVPDNHTRSSRRHSG